MRELGSPDIHYLNAATGWLDLGNIGEAHRELERISPPHQTHPDVLELQWRVFAAEKNWASALDAARRLVETDAENPSGWMHQSYSLHEMKRTQEAFDLLLPIAEQFSHISTIPYNLACYACQLGDLETARQWLAKAIGIRSKEDIKRVALADPDLKPMWEEIRRL